MYDYLKYKEGTRNTDKLSHHANLKRQILLETDNIIGSYNVIMKL